MDTNGVNRVIWTIAKSGGGYQGGEGRRVCGGRVRGRGEAQYKEQGTYGWQRVDGTGSVALVGGAGSEGRRLWMWFVVCEFVSRDETC